MKPISEWTVTDQATGRTTSVRLERKGRRGRKPRVGTIRKRLIEEVTNPAPRNSVRFIIGGREVAVDAAQPCVPFNERVERRRQLLRKRLQALSEEFSPPVGQAAAWYADVTRCVPASGRNVARQIARLCGEDSQVTVPQRSLADAVGIKNAAGRSRSYTDRGLEALVSAGWLEVESIGSKRNTETTYRLLPGDQMIEWFPDDDERWDDVEERE